jgi:large subunit ribosomal protein L18
MPRIKTPWAARHRRHQRVRRRVVGITERPRLCVFRSLGHIYAQVIDDTSGHTLASASTRESGVGPGPKTAVARKVGELVAERAKAKGVVQVVFDRAGYKYHGRVKALAEGAREGGLDF